MLLKACDACKRHVICTCQLHEVVGKSCRDKSLQSLQDFSYKILIRSTPIIMIMNDYIQVEQEKLLGYTSHEEVILKCILEKLHMI